MNILFFFSITRNMFNEYVDSFLYYFFEINWFVVIYQKRKMITHLFLKIYDQIFEIPRFIQSIKYILINSIM